MNINSPEYRKFNKQNPAFIISFYFSRVRMPLGVSYTLAYSAYVGSGPENSFKQLELDQLRGMSIAF